jgi:hypothetical protein
MAVSSSLLALMGWAVGRDRSIRDTDDRTDPVAAVAAVIGFVLALAISLTFPATGFYPLLLLLTGPITHVLRQGRGVGRRPTHMGE